MTTVCPMVRDTTSSPAVRGEDEVASARVQVIRRIWPGPAAKAAVPDGHQRMTYSGIVCGKPGAAVHIVDHHVRQSWSRVASRLPLGESAWCAWSIFMSDLSVFPVDASTSRTSIFLGAPVRVALEARSFGTSCRRPRRRSRGSRRSRGRLIARFLWCTIAPLHPGEGSGLPRPAGRWFPLTSSYSRRSVTSPVPSA